jgi:hypothetical protein
MPIRPEERDRYPVDWPAISAEIRFKRAEGRCECRGECGGIRHMDWIRRMNQLIVRCAAIHAQLSPYSGSLVVLTTAHLDHTPENCDPGNLRAMCQACHLAYDSEHHAQTRARRG